jgi:hypothetical protein
MICNVKDLSPDPKALIEALLGRDILENESVSIRAFASPDLSDERRQEIINGLKQYFAEVDANRKDITDEEAEEIINEALRSTRPGYRPIR